MAEQMVAQSPDRKAALWGLDQEFVGGAPLHAELLQAHARTAVEPTLIGAGRNFARLRGTSRSKREPEGRRGQRQSQRRRSHLQISHAQ